MKKRTLTKPCDRLCKFHYWSRKSYATFCSIRRYVLIGTLHYNVVTIATNIHKRNFTHSSSNTRKDIFSEHCLKKVFLHSYLFFILLRTIFYKEKDLSGEYPLKTLYHD